MKLCKDCKHYKEKLTDDGWEQLHACLKDAMHSTPCMVTGKTTVLCPSDCFLERSNEDRCGEQAKHWEAMTELDCSPGFRISNGEGVDR